MIEPTDEMVTAVNDAIDKAMRGAVYAAYSAGYWRWLQQNAVTEIVAALKPAIEQAYGRGRDDEANDLGIVR